MNLSQPHRGEQFGSISFLKVIWNLLVQLQLVQKQIWRHHSLITRVKKISWWIESCRAVVTIVFRMKKNFYILLLCSLNVWLAKNNLYVIVLLLYCSLENTQWQERTQKHQKLSKRTGDISIEIWTKYTNWQHRWKWTFCHIRESKNTCLVITLCWEVVWDDL